jgi:CMP/dCMP kinase
MIVTIDGPAGAGKSSAAKALARRLGFEFLDTGAMYRAVTLAAMRERIDLSNFQLLQDWVDRLRIAMPPGKVLLNDEDVTGLLRTSTITSASGPIASSSIIRRRLVAMQRTIAAERDWVCEGRDQGTVVFPYAACKFFLTADPIERAKRRQREMASRGEEIPWGEVLAAQQARDARDATRESGPMVPASDAILMDSTSLTLEQVVDLMEHAVRTTSKAAPA